MALKNVKTRINKSRWIDKSQKLFSYSGKNVKKLQGRTGRNKKWYNFYFFTVFQIRNKDNISSLLLQKQQSCQNKCRPARWNEACNWNTIEDDVIEASLG